MNTSINLLSTSIASASEILTKKANNTKESSVYERLCKKEATLALVGLGYVGLPIALEFAKDFKVIGFDINEDRVQMMKNGVDPSGELERSTFMNKDIHFTADASDLTLAQVIIVAVPTPVGKDKKPNLRPVTLACQTIGKALRKGDIVVFESTVYPGCTEEVCIPILEEVSGLRFNVDFKVGYSPERINPGDKKHTLTKITKIVSGSDAASEKEIYDIYNHIIEAGIHLAPSMKVAEAAKIVENTQRDVNIALMNELSVLFDELGINTHDVLKAAGTKWNFLNFYPGLVGGHCIGVDPYYLLHKANVHDVALPVIRSSRQINDRMPMHVVELVEAQLAGMGKTLAEAKVLVLGATFKENVTDLRNSKAAEMTQLFKNRTEQVDLVDPMADPDELMKYYGLEAAKDMADDYDAVIYAVNHELFASIDWEFIEGIINDQAVVFDFKRLLNKPQSSSKTIKYLTL